MNTSGEKESVEVGETNSSTPKNDIDNPHLLVGGPDPIRLHLPNDVSLASADTDDEITEKLKAQGVRLGKGLIAPAVFWPALITIILVALVAILLPKGTNMVLANVNDWIVAYLGWYYMLVVGGFVLFAIVLGFSKFGKITLGRDGEKPEFGVFSWFAMLFAAGMGIGLVFYGVGEPLSYATVDPKPGWSGDEAAIAKLSMAQTFIHWGLHPWAIYAVIGLALAYAIHRRGRPVSIRWALEPLLGHRVRGWMGDVIDILAIFGTVFGIATSLGLGVQQISSGLKEIGLVGDYDNTFLVILIVVITFLATMSVVSGVGAGIKWLSNINLSMAGLLLIAVLLLGPTLFLFQNLIESLGVYLANFFNMTFDVGAYTGDDGTTWASTWTIFYWGWWISWAPFVGVFIARISRGRTVREFIAGVLLVPTVVGFIWFAALGGTGIYQQLFGSGGLVDPDEGVVAEKALFDVLGSLPLGEILSGVAIILVAIFFITSSDSGSLVVDMLASGGHPNPPMWSRVLWAGLEGVLAIGLLLAGGLGALQAAALATALPFSIILILISISTVRAFQIEAARTREIETGQRYHEVGEHIADDFDEYLGDKVDARIDYRLSRTKGLLAGRQSKADKAGRADKTD